jgi:hypothetical protein
MRWVKADLLVTTPLLASAGKSGQTREYGIEQGAKDRALVEAGEDSAGLLLESSVTDFVGSTFQERTYTFLGRLHMKLQAKNTLTYRKRLRLGNFALGKQFRLVRQLECLAMPVKWRKAVG